MNSIALITTRLFRLLILLAIPLNGVASDGIIQGELEIHVREFATVPSRPNGSTSRLNMLTHADGRLFAVASLDGLIYEVEAGKTSVWADLAAGLNGALDTSDFVEGGIRSVAFHPEFSSNGLFYTSQLQSRAGPGPGIVYLSDATTPVNKDSVVTEWQIDTQGILSAPREVFRIGLPGPHVIKQIAFNTHATPGDADFGNLYIAHGDGGVWTDPIGGQNNDALGKILRINPQATSTAPYSIPADNPFIGNSNMPDEVFALGFRSPHHLSFSSDGTLISAEIGNRNVEEVNIVTNGADYGWKEREGTFVYTAPVVGAGTTDLPADDASFGYTYPAAQFFHDPDHSGGIAIAGGYPIENRSALHGQYLFGEFASKGELYYSSIDELKSAVTSGTPDELTQAAVYRANVLFDHDSDPSTAAIEKTSMLDVLNDSPMYTQGSTRADIRFGQGPSGEIYITSKQNNTIYLVTNTQPSSGITDLILVTGQSNVTGSQTESDPPVNIPVGIDAPHPRIFAYTDKNNWEVADLRQAWDIDGWNPGNDALTDTTRPHYNNFAFHFAKKVVENDPDRIVGLIIAGQPGEGIQHWDENSPFSQILDTKVLEALNAQGVKSQLDGILWHQGETDWQFEGTSDPDASIAEKDEPEYYPNKLNSLITRFRNKDWFDLNKPFICGETKQAPVNDRLMALNNDGDPWTGCVVGNDLTTRDATDSNVGTHFDANGLRTLGQRYAEQYSAMTANPIKIMAVGDSITQGVVGQVSYRVQLDSMLSTAGCTYEWVGGRGTSPLLHEGYSGQSVDQFYNTSDIESGRINELMTSYAPDVVLLHLGSNDMRKSESIESTIDELEVVLDRIQFHNNDATILMANVIPWWGTAFSNGVENENITEDIQNLGTAIENLIANRSDLNLSLVDVRSSFTQPMMTPDLVHPNRAGESFVADAFFDTYGTYYTCAQTPDLTAPRTFITVPAENENVDRTVTFSGYATDTGGSGISEVRIAIERTSDGDWYNFDSGGFGPISVDGNDVGIANATLANNSGDTADWSIGITLPAGDYRLYALAIDGAGNDTFHGNGLGVWPVSNVFSVESVDTIAPETLIDSPTQGESLSIAPTISGYATDDGGAAFDLVRVAIIDLSTQQWLNFSDNTFGGWSFTIANLSNTTDSYTDWAINTNLQPGNYIAVAHANDKAGNKATNPDGSNKWTSARFSVASNDIQPPETFIDSPTQGESLSIAPTISGYATDNGGAAFDLVRVAIIDLSTRQWLNFNNNTFGGWSFTTAILSNTTDSYTDWEVNTNLQPGNYIAVAHAYDKAGNKATNPDGSNKWTSARFTVE